MLKHKANNKKKFLFGLDFRKFIVDKKQNKHYIWWKLSWVLSNNSFDIFILSFGQLKISLFLFRSLFFLINYNKASFDGS